MSQRFPRSTRLTLSSQFEEVRKHGRSWGGKYLVLSILPQAEGSELKFGIITSRRVGRAHDRNKVRRRIRDIIRRNQDNLRAGFWMVVIARHTATGAGYSDLQSDWLRLAKRASILAAAQ